MAEPRFDPSKAVKFDLQHGLVHRDGAPPIVLVPLGGLLALCAAAGNEAGHVFGRAVGAAMGGRVASRLQVAAGEASAASEGGAPAGAVRTATLDAVVEHLGGELALGGFGSLSIERWGRALVLVVDHAPLGGAGDVLLEAILEGAIAAASGRTVRAGLLGREQERARFFVGSNAAIEQVWTWIADGTSWAEALVKLQGPEDADARGGA
jgi:hypothetical protein